MLTLTLLLACPKPAPAPPDPPDVVEPQVDVEPEPEPLLGPAGDPVRLNGVCEVSGAVPWGDAGFLVADDERKRKLYHVDATGIVGEVRLGPSPQKQVTMDDLEGLAFVGPEPGHLWATSSASLTKSKGKLGDRGLLLRMGPAGANPQTVALRTGKDDPLTGWTEQLEAACDCTVPADWSTLKAGQGGLNIEGLAVAEGGRVYLGLREPLVGPTDLAVVVALNGPGSLELGAPVFRESWGLALNPEGTPLGIRDLLWVDDQALILAGPTAGGPGSFWLYAWTPGQDPVSLGHIRSAGPGTAPEAIVLRDDTVWVLMDEGVRLSKAAPETPCKDAGEHAYVRAVPYVLAPEAL